MADPPLLSIKHSGGCFFLLSALTQQGAMGLVQKVTSDLQETRSNDQNSLKTALSLSICVNSGLHNWKEFDFRRGQRIGVNVSRVLDPVRQSFKGEVQVLHIWGKHFKHIKFQACIELSCSQWDFSMMIKYLFQSCLQEGCFPKLGFAMTKLIFRIRVDPITAAALELQQESLRTCLDLDQQITASPHHALQQNQRTESC